MVRYPGGHALCGVSALAYVAGLPKWLTTKNLDEGSPSSHVLSSVWGRSTAAGVRRQSGQAQRQEPPHGA